MATANDRLIDAMLQEQPPQAAPAEGNQWLQGAATAANVGLGLLPMTRLGRALFATMPRALSTLGGVGALNAAAAAPAEARPPEGVQPTGPAPPTGPSPAAADQPPRHANQERIDRLTREIEAAERDIETMSRRERDPDRLEVRSRPLQQRITAKTAERTGLQTEVDNAAKAWRDQQGARREEQRLANRTWREANPELARAWPAIVPLAALAAGAGTAALARGGRFLGNMPWHSAVRRARGELGADSPMFNTSARELGERVKSYAPNSLASKASEKLPGAAGFITGAELGMYPVQADIMNLGFDRAVESPWELGKAAITAGLGAYSGAKAGKIVSAALPASQPPVEASRALAAEGLRREKLLAAMQKRQRGAGGQGAAPPVAPPPPSAAPPTQPPPPVPPPATVEGATPLPPTPTPPPRSRQPSQAAQAIERQIEALTARLSPEERLAEVMLAKQMRLTPRQRLEYLFRRVRS